MRYAIYAANLRFPVAWFQQTICWIGTLSYIQFEWKVRSKNSTPDWLGATTEAPLKLLLILMICAPLWVVQCYAGSSAQHRTVIIESGTLMGTQVGSVEAFKGIPYAAPPVGALRWEPPAPYRGWTGVRDAANFGAICPQPERSEERIGDQPQSEDCLFLNVWTFAGAKRAPVMVWIHGGRSGSALDRCASITEVTSRGME